MDDSASKHTTTRAPASSSEKQRWQLSTLSSSLLLHFPARSVLQPRAPLFPFEFLPLPSLLDLDSAPPTIHSKKWRSSLLDACRSNSLQLECYMNGQNACLYKACALQFVHNCTLRPLRNASSEAANKRQKQFFRPFKVLKGCEQRCQRDIAMHPG